MKAETHVTNFGRNLTLTPKHLYTPRTEREVLDIMNRHACDTIRCVGRLHSWNAILQSSDVLLDLKYLNVVQTGNDETGKFAVVGAGCQIKHLISELKVSRQWTLPSLGFITEQTIAGAISTGTHGSGKHSLSHYVQSVRIAIYDPRNGQAVITEISSGDDLRAARCSLGCLGIILSVKIEARATYRVEEHFRVYSNIEDVLSAEQQFPLQQFYLVPWKWNYFAQHRRETTDQASSLAWLYHQYRFWVFDVTLHLLILFLTRALRIAACTRFAFKWIIPSFVIRKWAVVSGASEQLVMEHELFHHIELELFVQRSKLPAAMNSLISSLETLGGKQINRPNSVTQLSNPESTNPDLDRLRGKYCHHYPICIRKVLTDDTLISMASPGADPATKSEPWYSITLTNLHRGKNRSPFMEVMPVLTCELSQKYGARTHWGKLFGMSGSEIANLYPQLTTFLAIRKNYDPLNRFQNQWTKKCFTKHDNKT